MVKPNRRPSTIPKVLAVLPGFIPSTQINIITPLLDLCILRNLDFRLQLESTVKAKDVDWADIVILCRNTEPGQAWFQRVLQQKKRYIYDIDDNFFDISGDSPEAIYHRSPERLDMFAQYLRHASLVRVYSEPLHSRVLTINTKVVKVVPPMDFRHIRSRRDSSDTVKIVYATSRIHDELFSIFLPAVERILLEYNNKVEVYFLGFTPPSLRKRPHVHSIPMMWNYPAYLRRFSSAGYDIGLAPLLDDVAHRSKTNNKFREYGACRIAGIYSNVDVYASCVRQYETGILVSNHEKDWYDALVLLIENSHLRKKIQSAAYEFVRDNYSQDEFVKDWAGQIKDVLESQNLNKHILPVVHVDNLINTNQRSLLERVFDKFSRSNGWMSFFSLSIRIIRQRVSSKLLLWKYKIVIWYAILRYSER